MGFLDSKTKDKDETFKAANWLTSENSYGGRSSTPFMIVNTESGVMTISKAWRDKFNLKEDFRIAINEGGFNTAFTINPPPGYGFFLCRINPKNQVCQLSNKKLATILKNAYEIKASYKKILLKPMYFGRFNDLDLYKMIPYKEDGYTKYYDGRAIETQDRADPYPYPKEEDK